MSIITILIILLHTAAFCVFIILTDVYQKWVLDREVEKIRKRALKLIKEGYWERGVYG